MRKIIIDTDPGVDDAFAIIAAILIEDYEILGITTVAGNKGIELTTNNTLKILKFMKSDIAVYKGVEYISKSVDASQTDEETQIHGEEGLGGADLDFDYSNLLEKNAVDFIIEMAKKYPNELELVTLGPPTNIALAIEKDRKAMEGIKAIYSMGGAIKKGNVTPYAEFNYWFIPEAVEKMYSIADTVDIYMLGLDLTHQVIFDLKDLFFFKKECGEIGGLLYDMAVQYTDVYWDRYKYTGCVIHDLLTVLFAEHIDEIFPEKDVLHGEIQIVKEGEHKGQTLIDFSSKNSVEKNVYFVSKVDAKKCKAHFMSLIAPDKLELYTKYILK